MASGGSYLPLLTRPVSLAFIVLAVFLLARKETKRKKP